MLGFQSSSFEEVKAQESLALSLGMPQEILNLVKCYVVLRQLIFWPCTVPAVAALGTSFVASMIVRKPLSTSKTSWIRQVAVVEYLQRQRLSPNTSTVAGLASTHLESQRRTNFSARMLRHSESRTIP